MSSAFDRQVKPIYDAIDSGSPKSALVTCNKLLKKYPDNELLKALKSLSLVRCQRVEEALVICDQVLAGKPTNEHVLPVMMHVLRGLGRHKDLVTMFEEAYKQQPNNEDLAINTFFANARTGNWKVGQQIAIKMHKAFHEDRYLYWNVMSAILQAHEPSTPANMRQLLYKLAHRIITSASTPTHRSADRFYLHLIILRELSLFEEAKKLLNNETGAAICANSLSCNEVRREIYQKAGWQKEEGKRAEQLISQKHDRNWLEFVSVLDGVFTESSASDSTDEDRLTRVQALFEQVAKLDGLKDRSGSLALLDLERRARLHSLSQDSSRMLKLMQEYFQNFGDKACCPEDLKPFLGLQGDELTKWTAFLESFTPSFASTHELQRLINCHKLLRYNLSAPDLTVEAELQRCNLYAKHYMEGLALGRDLPSTELQPADDLAILIGNVLVNAWTISGDEGHLYNAVAFLEFALTKSSQAFQIRLILVRIYRLLGAPSLALEHYRLIGAKSVQHDTLSHFALSQSSNFSLAATGDLTYISECQETNSCYHGNTSETSEFVVRAFQHERYSQVSEFVEFETRVENSLQRDIIKMEHLRMRLTHEALTSDFIDLELIELKFSFDRPLHHDNRDFAILPNYQPKSVETFEQQTSLFGKSQGFGWLSAFLKIYIHAFQQASDLDDTVEEKLLIGDRPKQDDRPPLKTRLSERNKKELTELTEDELHFVKYADALAEWLEPFHDHTRPSPAQVLAEASKQTELRTGFPLKGVEISPPVNGHSSNGKKDEEPPVINEPPEMISQLFEDLTTRFKSCKEKSAVTSALHVANLAQQALILLGVETMRFKSTSVVKIHKLGPLVNSIKNLRNKALNAVQHIATELELFGQTTDSSDAKKVITDACSLLQSHNDDDFLLEIGKGLAEARKKVLIEFAKGMRRINVRNPSQTEVTKFACRITNQTRICHDHAKVTTLSSSCAKTTACPKMSDYYSNINGGGFMQGSSPFQGSQSPGGGVSRLRSDLSESTRPVTICQLHKATQAHSDAPFILDGFEINQVRLVGQVVYISRQTNTTMYTLDDGSSRIELRHWATNSPEEDAGKWGSLKEGMLVRATGSLKAFSSKRSVQVAQIQLVDDPHEPYFHVLEIVTATLLVEKGAPGQGTTHTGSNTNYAAQSHRSDNEQYSHLPAVAQSILNAIKSQNQGEGVHVAAIARSVGGDAVAISSALEKLMDDGLVYTTIDDSHFNVAD